MSLLILNLIIGIISGAIVSIITGIISILISLIIDAVKQRKRITYEIISNTLALNEEVKSQVQKAFNCQMQVTFNNKNEDNVQLVSVQIKNTGKQTVIKSDYDSLIRFDFGGVPNNAEVLAAEVLAAEPPALGRGIKIHGIGSQEIWMDPLTLNEEDSVTLQILVAGFNNMIKNNTLLRGVKQILKARVPGKVHIRNTLSTFIFLALVATVLFITAFTFIFESTYSKAISDYYLYNSFLVSVYVGSIIAAIIASIIHVACNCVPPLEAISDHQAFRVNQLRQPPSRITVISTLSLLPFVSGVFYFLIMSGLFTYIYIFIYTPEHLDSSLLEALNNSNLWGFLITIILVIIISLVVSRWVHRHFPLKIPANNS